MNDAPLLSPLFASGGHHATIAIATVFVLGVGAQIIAERLRLPAILLLLVTGFVAGNAVLGLVDPDEVLGDLLFPLVSLAVGIILFEGGLSLRWKELKEVGPAVVLLITLGTAITFVLGTAAAVYIVGLDWPVAALLGGILTVTGPTVIRPLLRAIRPSKRVNFTLKWEGILIDPIGALLAVLVFAFVSGSAQGEAVSSMLEVMGLAVGAGLALGVAGAVLLIGIIRLLNVADYLQTPLAFMLVIAAFAGTNAIADESGLLAVTVMGVILANQSFVDTYHMVEFKENLTTLLISTLFIVLSARIELATVTAVTLAGVGFLLCHILLIRPLSVMASTVGSELTMRERVFLSLMAPRGIVAAAVASVFALRLEQLETPQAGAIVPLAFLMIVGTVSFYGLLGKFIARWLGVAQDNPQGVVILGATPLGREIARTLQEEKFGVLVVDSNRSNVRAARLEGLPAYHGNVLSENILDELDLAGVGRFLAMTPNEEANALAALRFAEAFGRENIYQLPPPRGKAGDSRRLMRAEVEDTPRHLRGRYLFRDDATYADLARRYAEGDRLARTSLTGSFTYKDFCAKHGEEAVPLFVLTGDGRLVPIAADAAADFPEGSRLMSLVEDVRPTPDLPTGDKDGALADIETP